MPSPQETAWAAGLFEGEGSISGSGNQVVLRMHLTDEDVLRRFAEIVGRGHVYGPYKNSEKDGFKRKPFWAWVCYHRDECGVIIERFAPWLGRRRLVQATDIGIYP